MTPLVQFLDVLLQTMWRTADPDFVAHSGNYAFEERVGKDRQRAYEHSLPIGTKTFDAWDRWHRDRYLWSAIHSDVPETFVAINGVAAHSGGLAPEQFLLRVEGLEHALRETGFTVDDLNAALEAARSGKSLRKYSPSEAIDALAGVCDSLNGNPYSVRPRFAGFMQDVEDTLRALDWPDQIRDRFGLGHYAAMPGETIPIALMRYTVREVLAVAETKSDAVNPICVPTLLDAQFSRLFVPAPAELPYGRTLDLSHDENCERKIAEVLHLRLEYRPEHLFKVGIVTKGLEKLTSMGLATLRDGHVFCLQYDSGRNDFGTAPAHWGTP